MKRYLSFCLLLILLIPILTVPASASSQGVIDAIEEQSGFLAEWFGQLDETIVGFSEIVTELIHWSTYYYEEAIESIKSGIAAMKTNLSNIYSYFFVPNQKTLYYKIALTNGQLVIQQDGPQQSVTGMQRDLSTIATDIMYGFVTSLNSFYRLLLGDPTVSDPIEDEVDQDATEASEYLDIMDDVTQPEISELEDLSDISGYVNPGDVSTLAACLAPFFQSVVFLPCLMLSLIFMLVSYVLYGKR